LKRETPKSCIWLRWAWDSRINYAVVGGMRGHRWVSSRICPSKQSKPPERLLNRCDLFVRARILCGRSSRCYEAELLFTVQKPRALGHEAVLARDPFLDFLIGGALGWLLLARVARGVLTFSIVITGAHSPLRPIDQTERTNSRASPTADATASESLPTVRPEKSTVRPI